MADLSLSEKLADVREKLGIVFAIGKSLMPPFGEFQMATEDVRGHKMRVFKNVPPAVGDIYRSFLQEHAEKEWLIYEGERHTFKDVAAQMDALGAALAGSFGIGLGDKVGIAMRNLPEFMISFLGITSAGAVAVPLNSLWGTQELEYAVKDSGCKVVIADPERLKLCQPFLAGLNAKSILCRGDAEMAREMNATLWQQVLDSGMGKPRPSLAGVQADDDAMIMYTSGSTGFPKGVIHTQRSLGTFVKFGALSTKIVHDENPKSLMSVPLFHITALGGVFLLSLPRGEAIVLMRKWDAGEGLRLIESEKCTRFTGVPTMVRDMLEHPDYRPERMASMKQVLAGGAPVPPSQVSKMRQKAKSVQSGQVYGLTESMLGTMNRGVDYLKHPKSAGRPIPLVIECKIKDPETGKVLADSQRGEICLKGPTIMKGYHNRPEDTAKVFDEEGFFHTGDVGALQGGFLYIYDRLKDIIIRGGENIDCSEVEAALCSHPAIRECSVFGLPDERLGEVVGAAVWLQEQASAVELSDAAARTLAKFKVPLPENIFVHDGELPKGATGKIDKKGLRERYTAESANQPPRSRL